MKRKLTDEEIYEMLEKNGNINMSHEFERCLSYPPYLDFSQITDKQKAEDEELKRTNEYLSNHKEAFLEIVNSLLSNHKETFAKIGISKFIDVEPDPKYPYDFLMWTVI